MISKSVAFVDEKKKLHRFGSYRQTVRFFKDNYGISKTSIDDVLYRERDESKGNPDLINKKTLFWIKNDLYNNINEVKRVGDET